MRGSRTLDMLPLLQPVCVCAQRAAHPLCRALGVHAAGYHVRSRRSTAGKGSADKEKREESAEGVLGRIKGSGMLRGGKNAWVTRQVRDPYVRQARANDLRSRAAFKLMQMDEQHRILRPGMGVIDMGAAPGSWTQVAVDRVVHARGRRGGNGSGRPGVVVGADLKEMEPLDGATLVQMDVMSEEAPERFYELLGQRKADVLLSDMAGSASGNRSQDHIRLVALCECVLDMAPDLLAKGGTLLAKISMGGEVQAFRKRMQEEFRKVQFVKPGASRKESREIYILGKGFRGPPK